MVVYIHVLQQLRALSSLAKPFQAALKHAAALADLKQLTVDSKQLQNGPRTIYTDGLSFFWALGLKDSHVPTFWLLL